MQSNIYAQKENGDLRLLAEVEGLDDPGMAVDALLDEHPRLKQREFVVISLDNVIIVEAGDEIVQPRRQMTIRSGNNVGAVASEPEDEEADEEDEDEQEDEEQDEEQEPEEEKPAPKPRQQSRNRSASKGRSSGGTGKRQSSRARSGSKSGKSPFKANPKSAE